MKVLIIEDEPLGAEALQKLLLQVDDSIEILAIKDSVSTATDWLASNPPPDLIFMDIELSDGQCFELFESTRVQSPVIFTTSYDEFALKAFRHNGIDYLLKPIQQADLTRSLTKVKELKTRFGSVSMQETLDRLARQLQNSVPTGEYRDRFLIKQGQKMFSVGTDEIAYFFSKDKACFIKLKSGKEYLVDYTLDQLQLMLTPQKFHRLNRHIIACHAAIASIHTWFNGKLKIDLLPPSEEEIIVSRDKAKDFRRWMGE